MKKLMSIFLILLILLTLNACGSAVNTNEEKHQYVAFPNTDWGMTKQECMEALNLKEKDIKEIEGENSSSFQTDLKYDGVVCTASFYFREKSFEKDFTSGLAAVELMLPSKEYTIDDFNAISDKVEQVYSKKGIDYKVVQSKSEDDSQIISKHNTINCETTINDLADDKVKTKAVNILNAYYSSSEKVSSEDDSVSTDLLVDSQLRTPISFTTIRYLQYAGEKESMLKITYKGIYASLINTIEKE